MKRIGLLTTTALAIAFGATASGQTSVTPEQRPQSNAFFAGMEGDEGGQIRFITGAEATIQDQQAGFRVLDTVQFGQVYDFCADFTEGEDTGATYLVSPGFNGLESGQQSSIRFLFSHALPEFNGLFDAYLDANGGSSDYNPALASQYDALQGYAGGLQVALWEIIHEQVATLSVLDTLDPTGVFKVDADHNTPGRAQLAIDNAQTFLTNIQDGGDWNSDAGGLNYYYANGGSHQDRLWISIIPEPSTALLGGLGAVFLLRRRR